MGEVRPQGRAEVIRLLESHEIRARRSMGQHFLADPNLVRKVVEVAGVGPGDRVLEVGSGTGTLTRALAEAGCRVLSYEIDRRLAPLLEEVLGDLPGVELRFEDALAADLPRVLGEEPWVMVANLPYHVGTPLLLTLLREAPQVVRFVVMVQREVALRLAAPPGGRDYGIPSVVTQLHATVRLAFRVPPGVFIPPPKVDSTVVVLRRRPPPLEAPRAIELATAAFSQRRKMLRNSLGAMLSEEVLTASGLAPDSRPEAVAPEQWVELARTEAAGAR